ncbi:MAG: phytanoyl-CoA dioxygenase family protein [Gammaproteobacteria bacterium]|nr:phytanoyl-CoA dioxygenase family protein [Gammaproteobacteria bacterium]
MADTHLQQEHDDLRVVQSSDLRFIPVQNEQPKKLTHEQIERFNTDGFVEPLTFCDESEATKHRTDFDVLLAELKSDGRDSYALDGYHAQSKTIWDLATDSRILDYVEDLIGPNIICWSTHYFCKLAGDTREVPFHQDAAYWPLRPARTVTVWLAIDKVTMENGPLCFIAGSHRYGRFEWRKREHDVVLNLEVQGHENLGKKHPLVLFAGQFSMHSDMLVHGSAPNPSGVRRCGIALRYVMPEVWLKHPEHGAAMKNSIICRGMDPTGNWPHNSRPLGDDIRKRH